MPVKLRVDPEKAIDYRREDAQADLLGMMHPLTVVVGHTLHKDLDVLRLNVPVVLDISLLQLGQRQSHPGIASIVISCVQPLVRMVGDLIVVTVTLRSSQVWCGGSAQATATRASTFGAAHPRP